MEDFEKLYDIYYQLKKVKLMSRFLSERHAEIGAKYAVDDIRNLVNQSQKAGGKEYALEQLKMYVDDLKMVVKC